MGVKAKPGHLLTKVFLKTVVAVTNTALSVSVWLVPLLF